MEAIDSVDGMGWTFASSTLAKAIIGPPLNATTEAHDCVVATLDNHLAGLEEYVRKTYPLEDIDMEPTIADIKRVRAMAGTTAEELVAKRAMVLLSMYMEENVTLHHMSREIEEREELEDSEEQPDLEDIDEKSLFAYDMDTRVLPTLIPTLMRTMCQRPEAFVQMAAVLNTMWKGEDLELLFDKPHDQPPEQIMLPIPLK